MTTIAYKAGIMAADSRCTEDGYFATKCQKIFRLPNGALLGSAGDGDCRDLIKLLGACKNAKTLPSRKELIETKTDFAGILVFLNGDAFFIDIGVEVHHDIEVEWRAGIMPVEEPWAAVGSGHLIALGVMAFGGGAKSAVTIACRYDTRSGPPVHAVALKPETSPASSRRERRG